MKKSQHQFRIIWWLAVVLYTAALPYVILIYTEITRHYSAKTAGNIPLAIIIFAAVAFAIAGARRQRIGRCVIIIAVNSVIVFTIMTFEANANKHIHIPEYVLMTWLLYQAMVIDYKGRGILLLVFICASMLGVVDELMQGIHPQRTYGWKDMIIDASSSFIGILTLMGVKYPLTGDWSWIGHLKHCMTVVGAILVGVPTTVLMCIHLFAVQARGSFDNVYPGWLIAGNVLFLAGTVAALFFCWHLRPRSGKFKATTDPNTVDRRATALLWVICPLVILTSMNLLVVWVAVAGVEFK